MDVGSYYACVHERQQAAIGWPTPHRVDRRVGVWDRSQRLPPVLMMLAPRPFDDRDELAVGVWVRRADSLQPLRRVVGTGDRDQADQELHDPDWIRLDERRAELLQPEADRAGGHLGTVGHAHRPIDR